MSSQITLGVYRRLDNRLEGLSDDSRLAHELHDKRKKALHEVLDGERSIEVFDWGQTDDEETHEFVEIVLGAAASTTFTYVIVPGLEYVAKKLAEKVVDQATSELAKWLISVLRSKQKSKEILDFTITLPDKTQIHVDPPDTDAEITITSADGTVSSVKYSS